MPNRLLVVIVVAWTALESLTACQPSAKAISSSSHGEPHAYAPGRWRLAPFEELDRTVLWVSHIVVMSDASRPLASRLRNLGWQPDSIPRRSSAEAAVRVQRVKELAQAHPERFAELAREYSDDVVSRSHGGSLGGVRATQLPPAFVDAWAALAPGQVSEVVETPLGFHILLRRIPPPIEDVHGQRVVVRYDTTVGDQPVERSRTAALELARSIAAEARAGAKFSELVQKYSDDPDASRAGDMGVWRTTEPLATPIALEVLSQLQLGAISEPIETISGFQVVKRIPLDSARVFAMRAVRIPFDNSAESEERARQQALQVVDALRKQPSAFANLQARYAAGEVERWSEGHGDPVVTAALDGIAIGSVAESPLRVPPFYLIVQRLDPDQVSNSPTTNFALPARDTADIEHLISVNDNVALAQQLSPIVQRLSKLTVSTAEHTVLEDSLTVFNDALQHADSSQARLSAYRNALRSMHRGLSEARYAEVVTAIELLISQQVLTMAQQG